MKQETLVTQYYAQIVGLSETHCHKAFYMIKLSLKSWEMECYWKESIEEFEVKS